MLVNNANSLLVTTCGMADFPGVAHASFFKRTQQAPLKINIQFNTVIFLVLTSGPLQILPSDWLSYSLAIGDKTTSS